MSQPNISSDMEQDRALAAAQARAELLRFAEEQGVSPVTDFDDLLGDPPPEDAGDDDVEHFLSSLREWRQEDTPSQRGVE